MSERRGGLFMPRPSGRVNRASAAFDITTLPEFRAAWNAFDTTSLWQNTGRTTPADTAGQSVQTVDDISDAPAFGLVYAGTAPVLQSSGAVRLSGSALFANATGLSTRTSFTVVLSMDWRGGVDFARLLALCGTGGTDYIDGLAIHTNPVSGRVLNFETNFTANAIWTPASLPTGRVTATFRYRCDTGKFETRINGTVVSTVYNSLSNINMNAICFGCYYAGTPTAPYFLTFDLFKGSLCASTSGNAGYISDTDTISAESWAGGTS